METTMCYEKGAGDRLIDPRFFPEGVKVFLEQEKLLLDTHFRDAEVLVEIGCMSGRYVDWAVNRGCQYLGIDPVERYIQEGQQRLHALRLSENQFRFHCTTADKLPAVLQEHFPHISPKKIYCLYPFNSIGNMMSIRGAIRALACAQTRYFISSYQTTDEAIAIREKYYSLCGFTYVRVHRLYPGVLFSSRDGLHTIAYHPEIMCKMLADESISTRCVRLGSLGCYYLSMQ